MRLDAKCDHDKNYQLYLIFIPTHKTQKFRIWLIFQSDIRTLLLPACLYMCKRITKHPTLLINGCSELWVHQTWDGMEEPDKEEHRVVLLLLKLPLTKSLSWLYIQIPIMNSSSAIDQVMLIKWARTALEEYSRKWNLVVIRSYLQYK